MKSGSIYKPWNTSCFTVNNVFHYRVLQQMESRVSKWNLANGRPLRHDIYTGRDDTLHSYLCCEDVVFTNFTIKAIHAMRNNNWIQLLFRIA